MSEALNTRPPVPSSMNVRDARRAMRERLDGADSAEVADRIVQNIMQAETPDDLLSGGEVTAVEDVLDVPISILGFRAAPSEFNDDDVFAIIDAVRADTGEVLTIGCGGAVVMAQLLKAAGAGWFPLVCKFRRAETRQGRRVYRLVRAGAVLEVGTP